MSDIRNITQERVRRWLERLPDLTGKPLSKIASEAGLVASTLTKPANDPSHKHVMSAVTIAKIISVHNVPPPEGFESLAGPGFAEEAVPFEYDAEPDLNELVKNFIAGRPGVHPWTLTTRAIENFGYRRGDVVILDLNAAPRREDIVAAQVYDHDLKRTDTIWRYYDPPYLIAGSTDPGYVRPIHEDSVAMKGAVLISWRPRPKRL